MVHIFVCSVLLLGTLSAAGDVVKPIPKVYVWRGDGARAIRVKVDHVSRGVTVTVNQDKDRIFKSIGITFYDASGKKTPLELKAIEFPLEPGLTPGSAQTRFSGSLSPAMQSFVGFELRIPLGSDAPTLIRSEDLKRAD